jgi:membrane fusion protein (multidrug efflux system)
MRHKLIVGVGLLVVVVAAVALSRHGEGDESSARAGRPPVAVETVAASLAPVEEAVEVVGTLAPKFAADVKSEFTAVVRDVYVTEWVRVHKGQPLARLDTREGEIAVKAAEAALLQARVAETRARREAERAEKLKGVGLVTQQQLDDSRTAREAAEASTAAAQAQLDAARTRLDKALIRSPMDGVVAFRGVSVGDRVENMGSSPPMFRIVDTDRFDLTVSVPASESAALRVGQPLTFSFDALPGRTFTGRVSFINPAVDEASRSVKVVAEVPNTGGELRAGLFVKGRIVTGKRAAVLQVPRAALLRWDVAAGEAEVFVTEGAVAQRRAVRTGDVSGERVEIREGLAAGERVVTRGAFNLRDGDRVRLAADASPAA